MFFFYDLSRIFHSWVCSTIRALSLLLWLRRSPRDQRRAGAVAFGEAGRFISTSRYGHTHSSPSRVALSRSCMPILSTHLSSPRKRSVVRKCRLSRPCHLPVQRCQAHTWHAHCCRRDSTDTAAPCLCKGCKGQPQVNHRDRLGDTKLAEIVSSKAKVDFWSKRKR